MTWYTWGQSSGSVSQLCVGLADRCSDLQHHAQQQAAPIPPASEATFANVLSWWGEPLWRKMTGCVLKDGALEDCNKCHTSRQTPVSVNVHFASPNHHVVSSVSVFMITVCCSVPRWHGVIPWEVLNTISLCLFVVKEIWRGTRTWMHSGLLSMGTYVTICLPCETL